MELNAVTSLGLGQDFGMDLPEPSGEIERMLADLHGLRRLVLDAWQGRALTLDKAERLRLRDEIRSTCEMLLTLTNSD